MRKRCDASPQATDAVAEDATSGSALAASPKALSAERGAKAPSDSAASTEAASKEATPVAQPPPMAVPKVLRWNQPANYEITEILGSGAYGTVCEALDRSTNKLVAIKRVREMFMNLTDCKRILREIAIQTRLSHNNIVRLYDVVLPVNQSVDTFTELYIVMEICDQDLRHLIKMDIFLQSNHILTLLYNLLAGLAYLHSAGVYHRDLKPANCMVMQDCTVKIGDFGLARAVASVEPAGSDLIDCPPPAAPGTNEESSARMATLRAKRILTNHVVTRLYRAPELILLHTNYTEAIDVWSVGCIFAELLQILEGSRIDVNERSPLFPGLTAYPREPAVGREGDYLYHTQSPVDQMNVIFNIIGTPSTDAIQELKIEDSRRYLALFTAREGEGFQKRLPHVDAQSLDLLQRMLCFRSSARITVAEALAHPVLRDVREEAHRQGRSETLAPCQVTLGFDATLNFERDLRKGTTTQEKVAAQLRSCFGEELARIHQESSNGSTTAFNPPLRVEEPAKAADKAPGESTEKPPSVSEEALAK